MTDTLQLQPTDLIGILHVDSSCLVQKAGSGKLKDLPPDSLFQQSLKQGQNSSLRTRLATSQTTYHGCCQWLYATPPCNSIGALPYV